MIVSQEARKKMMEAARSAFVERWGQEPAIVFEPERLPLDPDVYGDYINVSVTARESIEHNRRGPRVHVLSAADPITGDLVTPLSFDYHTSVHH